MKALIVEDDENKRAQLLVHIRALYPEMEVVQKSSFQSGLKELLEGRYDVVLLDMSMPTYDKSPVEPGGRPRPFAGKEILAHIQRRGFDTPVIVVTQFETFGEGAASMSLTELKAQLRDSYPKLYLGSVYYSAAQSRWQAELKRLLALVESNKKTQESVIKALIVEDGEDKARRIRAVLESGGCKDESVVVVRDVVSAVAAVERQTFDILLVDLLIPMRSGQLPDRTGGVRLIREVQKPSGKPRPRYIVGVTAYEDLAEEHTEFFAENLYGLVVFDISSDAWVKAIKNLLAHAIAADSPRNTVSYDLAVICALDSPELKAILALPLGWKRLESTTDSTEYQIGEFAGRQGKRTVIAASCPQMGMPAAAALTMKMILQYCPRYIAMTGIAAAMSKELEFGDVVLADPTWDYGSGKLTEKNVGEIEFEQEPWQVRVDPIIKMQFKALAKVDGLLDRIREEWLGNKPKTVLSLRLGPLGSGAAVVAAKSMARRVKNQNRKVHALDMETYGVMLAALLAPLPSPHAFSIKGIADFGNKKKNDAYQAYASHTSAGVLWAWAQRYL